MTEIINILKFTGVITIMYLLHSVHFVNLKEKGWGGARPKLSQCIKIGAATGRSGRDTFWTVWDSLGRYWTDTFRQFGTVLWKVLYSLRWFGTDSLDGLIVTVLDGLEQNIFWTVWDRYLERFGTV